MENEIEAHSKGEQKEPPINWIAMLIDGAASQYGWTEREIMNLPLARAKAYMEAMGARLGGEDSSVVFSKRADKVRHEYLKKFESLNNKKQAKENANKD